MKLALPSLLVLTAALLAGCSDASDDHEGHDMDDLPEGGRQPAGASLHAPVTLEVMAMDNAFSPQQVTVRVGDTIHWVDHDALNPHNVVSSSPGNEFRSPDMDAALPTHDRSFDHTFASAGTVDYVCEYHSGMVGTVTVTA